MSSTSDSAPGFATVVITLVVGVTGAGLGYLIGAPAYFLTGPAFLVTVCSVAGLRLGVSNWLRDAAFLVLGVGIGSTVTERTTEDILRWPLAFVGLAVMLAITLWLCQKALQMWFGFDRKSAILAAAPGHLSFVIGLGSDLKADLLRITVAQSFRLLSLTLFVPVLAMLMGYDVPGNAFVAEFIMPWGAFLGLLAVSILVGLGLMRLNVPAALLIGAMIPSGIAHAGGWVHGGLHPWLSAFGFIVLGALIGTRFTGVSWTSLRQAAGAGLASTLIAVAVTAGFAIPMAAMLGMTSATMLAAFAPGGFETMVALGAVLGANPGFVVTCHIARLLILTVMIPAFLAIHAKTGGRQ